MSDSTNATIALILTIVLWVWLMILAGWSMSSTESSQLKGYAISTFVIGTAVVVAIVILNAYII